MPSGHSAVALLNEVLSLNAQESVGQNRRVHNFAVLNEVLSLNAQEFCRLVRWLLHPCDPQ